MVQVGLLLSDVPLSVPPQQQFSDVLRIVEAAQRNGFSHIAVGQHFLYGDLRWLQPVPLLARLSAELDPATRIVTQVMIGPVYSPVMLAEEIATLDIVSEGRLVFGVGLGYRPEEYAQLGVPFEERGRRFDELLEVVLALWTQDEVTFDGRYTQLDRVRPHLQPVQDPHPPLWIGAHAMAGVRRAGRFGDGYACTPEATRPEIAARYRVVMEGFAERGRPFVPQPLRRNCWIGDTRDEALVEFARVAKGRYITYTEKGLGTLDGGSVANDFVETIRGRAVVGTAADVVAELTDLATSLPVDPILIRPGWPTMTADETIAVLDRFGSEVLPALAAITPRTDIDPELLASLPSS